MALPKIIAHRGGREWAPENTLSAFRKSVEMGADGIELDVQRCSTGELVVFHDEDLNRTTNGVGLVKEASWPELQRLSAGAWFDGAFKDERVPLLSQVLEVVAGRLVINIELKNAPVDYPDMEADMLEVIEGYPHETLIISSFDHKMLQRLHQKAPHLKIALLGACVFLDLKEACTAVGAKYFHPAYDCLREDVVEEAHLAGIQVNVWTCNTKAEWKECVRMKVDGIVTNDPVGLKEYLSTIEKQKAAK